MFFRRRPKCIKMINKSTRAAPGTILSDFSWLLEVILASVFRLVLKWRKPWIHCTGHSFGRFFHRKTGHCSIHFSSIFRPSLRNSSWRAFWNQKRRSTLKRSICGAPSDFEGCQNGPWISNLGQKCQLFFDSFVRTASQSRSFSKSEFSEIGYKDLENFVFKLKSFCEKDNLLKFSHISDSYNWNVLSTTYDQLFEKTV